MIFDSERNSIRGRNSRNSAHGVAHELKEEKRRSEQKKLALQNEESGKVLVPIRVLLIFFFFAILGNTKVTLSASKGKKQFLEGERIFLKTKLIL